MKFEKKYNGTKLFINRIIYFFDDALACAYVLKIEMDDH